MTEQHRETYSIEIEGLHRDLPLFEVAPGVTIAIVNILGDTELIEVSANALAERLADLDADVLVTAEAKSIPLLYALAVRMKLPWVVLRKTHKPYMGEALSADTESITTGSLQTLFLDEKDRQHIMNKRVVLVDDVVSTGSTLQGMERVVSEADGNIVARAAMFTEGDQGKWSEIIALGHLPVFLSDT
ncbi:MAG: adenine phosphoribosyltransferase [Chloroflexi bacterium]|nr:adenine phosphoribosyltransferase [Chloroflexota bacterium]